MSLDTMTIAQTIRQQIGREALWCAGAHQFMALDEAKGFAIAERLGGLQFKVNGSQFRGKVLVELRPDDTYAVSFVKIRGVDVRVHQQVGGDADGQGVYCADLAILVNRVVEGYEG